MEQYIDNFNFVTHSQRNLVFDLLSLKMMYLENTLSESGDLGIFTYVFGVVLSHEKIVECIRLLGIY